MTGCPPSQYQQPTRGYVPYNHVFQDAPSIPYQSYDQSSASTHLTSSYLFRNPSKFWSLDTEMITPTTARNRRKGASGDQVKHRRTRSGCFTCRTRRVKCDEARPVCERCRKGSRECAYPDQTSSKSPTDGKGDNLKNPDDQDSSGDESNDGEDQEIMDTIIDEDASPSGSSRQALSDSIRAGNPPNYTGSETPSLVTDHGLSPSPSTEGSAYNSTAATVLSGRSKGERYKGKNRPPERPVPDDIRFYLKYFVDNITYHHFSMKYNADDVLQSTFLDIALSPGNEALLNAVVGFSAYHCTLQNPQGKIQDFLQYYNKAVTLLLLSLKKSEKASLGTLLCMLQLAAIEEFLGDWVNLLGHQKAACALLMTIYTPENISYQPIGRMLLGWYTRFDLYGALIGGYRSMLPRKWITCPLDYSVRMMQQLSTMQDVDDTTYYRLKINLAVTQLRMVSYELANLTSDITKGRISFEQFAEEEKDLSARIEAWWTEMDPALLDPKFAVTDFTGGPPSDYPKTDVVNPYEPGLLLRGELWPMNILRQDQIGVVIMLKYLNYNFAKLAGHPHGEDGGPLHLELQKLSYQTLQYFEAVEYWPGSPKGSVVGAQAALGIAPLLLPRDDRHEQWFRKKMAVVECQGYIYATTYRERMSQVYQDPTILEWWFPDHKGCPPVIKIIHDFVEERSSAPKDEMTEDLKSMSQIFKGLNLDSEESSSSKSKSPSMEPSYDQDSPNYRN